MKKQFAALLALSTAAACVLSYQPVQAGAESVLDSMTQENLTDITNEQKDAFYQSSLGEIEPSAEPSELEQAATANGMYKDTFSFTNHSCNLSEDDFNQKIFEPIWNSMTNIERLAYLNKSSVYRNVCQGSVDEIELRRFCGTGTQPCRTGGALRRCCCRTVCQRLYQGDPAGKDEGETDSDRHICPD